MKMPLNWAKDYAPITCTAQEFADKMTMSGSKVETFESEADSMCNVVLAQIDDLQRHPDSDHLWVCSVNTGEETVQIVTGAQNLQKGDLCPAALPGAKLPNGLAIKRGKLRGVESNGMLCSLGELGLTVHDFPAATEDGILVLQPNELPTGWHLGMNGAEALGMDDVVFDFEITPNRPDCLSVRALAREAAATFGVPFTEAAPPAPQGSGDVTKLLKASIACPDTCLRYSAAVVENVRIQPSPLWLRKRLRECGVRPINNIVDITNYVMLEYGQPMHAFDYAYVNGAEITVRMAAAGEEIETLDGVVRKLTPDMMVIADAKGPIAIAGIMGGEYSGVYASTTRIVFESACFAGPSVRVTSRRLGLRTESSGRYEKGLNPENAGPALRRALQLVKLLDAGDIVTGVLDEYPSPRTPGEVPLRADAINALLGISVPREEMVKILEPLGFVINGDTVTVPTDRADVKRYNDLAEEIARFVGYNNIPQTNLRGAIAARPTPRQSFDEMIAEKLVGYGLWECETFSFYSLAAFDMVRLPQQSPLRNPVKIMNPLGEETSIMRTTALPSILEVAGRNWASRNESAALFEIATEYLPTESDADLPTEKHTIVMACYGPGWDYAAVKGIAEGLFSAARLGKTVVRRNSEGTTFHPGRCADIFAETGYDNKGAKQQLWLARIGEAHPEVADAYGIKPRVILAEISLDALFACRGKTPQYSPLPKFPAITRDLALVADMDTPAADIAERIRMGAGKILESLTLFDVYTGENLGGRKSLAYSMVLRDKQTTLTDADAERVTKKILKLLSDINVELRA